MLTDSLERQRVGLEAIPGTGKNWPIRGLPTQDMSKAVGSGTGIEGRLPPAFLPAPKRRVPERG